jgi:hypothetical protein
MATANRFFTITELVTIRRWKRELIPQLLGKPDWVIHGAHKNPAQMYASVRVISAEETFSPFRGRRGVPRAERACASGGI